MQAIFQDENLLTCDIKILFNYVLLKAKYPAPRDQIRELIDSIRKGPEEYYNKFREALISTGQGHVVNRWLPAGGIQLNNRTTCIL